MTGARILPKDSADSPSLGCSLGVGKGLRSDSCARLLSSQQVGECRHQRPPPHIQGISHNTFVDTLAATRTLPGPSGDTVSHGKGWDGQGSGLPQWTSPQACHGRSPDTTLYFTGLDSVHTIHGSGGGTLSDTGRIAAGTPLLKQCPARSRAREPVSGTLKHPYPRARGQGQLQPGTLPSPPLAELTRAPGAASVPQ